MLRSNCNFQGTTAVNRESRTANGQLGLDRSYVTSPKVWEQESLAIFRRHWLCVGREIEFTNTSVTPFVYLGQQLLAVRGDDGQLRVFRNFCRHRGSLMVTSEECASVGQRLQCPYHAWTYDRQGRLVAAPNMEGVPGFEKQNFGLFEVPSAIEAGFLWICFEPQELLQEFLSPLQSVFQAWQVRELRVGAEIQYQVQANWKLLFQNYSECYHCPTVHPALNRLTPYLGSANSVDEGPILGGPMQLADSCQTMSNEGEWVGTPLPLLDKDQQRQVHYFTIFPSMFLSVHPDYVLIHRMEPTSPYETKVSCQFLFQQVDLDRLGFDPESAVRFWDLTNRQDWEVCERSQRGMEDPAYVPGPYSNLESIVAAFDRNYLRSLHRAVADMGASG